MKIDRRCLLLLAVAAACEMNAEEERERSSRPANMVFDGVTYELARSPAQFSVGFTTYAPADVAMQVLPGEQGESVRFVADADSTSDPAAFVHVYVFPDGMTRENAQVQLESFVASRGVPVSEREAAPAPFSEEGIPPEAGPPALPAFPWSIWEHAYAYNCAPASDACRVGRAILGEHDGRLFQVIVQYPPAAVGDFLPRARNILEQWVWE